MYKLGIEYNQRENKYLLPPFILISRLPFIALQPDSSLRELTLVTMNGLSLP